MSNQLIPVFSKIINNDEIKLVDARELHKFLESKQQFANWIDNRIKDYGLIQNEDFLINLLKTPTGGRPQRVVHLTLDTAKELSMVERTEKGRQARKYFIECEKQLNGQSNNGYITQKLPRPKRKAIKSRDDLSFTKRNEHGHMINWNVPNRVDSWHEAYGIGEMWFDEIVELARNNKKEALDAMIHAVPVLAQNYKDGYSEGFYDQMARWALTGMLEHKGDLSLPFKTLDMRIEPKEGFNHYLNQI